MAKGASLICPPNVRLKFVRLTSPFPFGWRSDRFGGFGSLGDDVVVVFVTVVLVVLYDRLGPADQGNMICIISA